MIKNFNNLFAVWLTAIIAGIWIADGRGWIDISGEVLGVMVSGWVLIIQYYFRKKQNGDS